MVVKCSQVQWRSPLLILAVHQLFRLGDDVLEAFKLAVARREMHDCVTKLICQVRLSALVRVQCMKDLRCTHLSCDEDCTLFEFVLNVRIDATFEQVGNHLLFVTLRCVVEEALAKAVCEVKTILRALK